MVRVLIVGAGITGALCAHMLRRHLPTQLQCQIVVWEKSRGVGGRMSLSRCPQCKKVGGEISPSEVGGQPTPTEVGEYTAELGAQYVAQNPKYVDEHKEFHNELREYGILTPLNGNIEGFRGVESANFVSKNGLNSIAKHFFAKASANICSNKKLESLKQTSENPTSELRVWEARTAEGKHDHFDAVILTMPVPQILAIEGVKGYLSQGQIDDLDTVEYSSRFAMALFYEAGIFNVDLPYVAKYVTDSNIIRYIAVDHKKRKLGGDFSSLVVHTSVPFGKTHLEENAETVGLLILDEMKKLIPSLPPPNYVKHHKWRYSQVTNATRTFGCIVAATKPLMVVAGDGFTHSNFDGCVQSALKVGEEIGKWVKTI